MNNLFVQSIESTFKGAYQAVTRFFMSSFGAFVFMLITLFRIQSTDSIQNANRIFFDSLQWSAALIAIVGLASVTYVRSRNNQSRNLLIANSLTAVSGVVAFLLLYFLGGTKVTSDSYYRYPGLTNLAQARMAIVIGVVFIAFILFAAKPWINRYVARTIFMTEKSVIISGIYGFVLLAGTAAVAGAIQGLLYPAMSFKVYQHLSTMIGFIAFMLFLGYLPDFSKGEEDQIRREREEQPGFIQLLFSYIIVPITLSLTVVLLLWTVRIIFQGVGENFLRLSGIATTYTVVGIWLHIMVQEADNALAKFYMKVYPMATLIILAFEGWAIFNQLRNYSMQTTEYYFVIVWIVAIIAMILLVMKMQKSYAIVLAMTMFSMIFTVLPIVGYQSLPIMLQTNRLEKLLTQADMFDGAKIIPSSSELARIEREKITVAATFLSRQDQEKVPKWLKIGAYDDQSFKEVMGFDPIFPRQDDTPPTPPGQQVKRTILRRDNQAFSISPFDWQVPLVYSESTKEQVGTFKGAQGEFKIKWQQDDATKKPPTIEVTLDEREILKESLATFTNQLMDKYPPTVESSEKGEALGVSDLQFNFESPEIKGSVMFSYIEIMVDENTDETTYWTEIEGIYVSEATP
ncbi:hypothetical protein ACWOEJ_03750 [Enterococcus eurekensis]|uniref:DUF4153 domain-containing protein n=1 Tax=Enterococcus eurekensis TaxID=1159753 RepID=A0ABV9M2J0_9ENTE